MSDATTPLVRFFGPDELPVRIPDWPGEVGVAVCRLNGKTLSFQPYHRAEAGQALRKRLPQEVGEALQGFAAYPAMRGLSEARISYAEDQRITVELENALRSMPRLIELVQDFAINFDFAAEEGLGLDGLNDGARRKAEISAMAAQKSMTEPLPVGYHPFREPDRSSEVISGAFLRPVGAAGIDLVLVENAQNARAVPPETTVLVREDSLRVAIPLAPVLVDGRLPPVLRLPAGSLLLGQSNGKPVPANVLRRGNFLFIAPEFSVIASAAQMPKPEKSRALPWKAIGLGLAGLVLVAAVGTAAFFLLPQGGDTGRPQAPVESLRSGLFAPAAE